MRRPLRRLSIILIVGCSEPTAGPEPQAAQIVTVYPLEAIVGRGQAVQYQAFFAGRAMSPDQFVWRTADSTLARISAAGLFTAAPCSPAGATAVQAVLADSLLPVQDWHPQLPGRAATTLPWHTDSIASGRLSFPNGDYQIGVIVHGTKRMREASTRVPLRLANAVRDDSPVQTGFPNSTLRHARSGKRRGRRADLP